jgi:hypothetical protein
LRILDTDLREKILEKIISDGLNVSKTEELIEQTLSNNEPKKQKPRQPRDMNSFYASIDRLVNSVKQSGVDIKSRVIEGEEFTEVTILIPSNV